MAAEPPDVAGQWVEAEEHGGQRFRVRCLGEPVEVGMRIAFAPSEPGADGSRAALLRIVEAPRAQWVARVVPGTRGALWLLPFAGVEAPRLQLVEADAKGAQPGDRVVVVPKEGPPGRDRGRVSRARRHRTPSDARRGLPVKVVEVLGPAGDPTADHRAVVWKHRLPQAFSRRARREAEVLEEAPGPRDEGHRIDLRHLPFVTIDPASARDHDDALFAEAAPSSPPLRAVDGEAVAQTRPRWAFRLWVAIADVAHFIEPGSFLGAEARRRGNSFYFPDRSIPMLPERLSSDLCSLRPDLDRRAMVVELRLDERGRVLDALFHEAWIRSRARLAYEEAAARFEARREGEGASPPAEWDDAIDVLDQVTSEIAKARRAAGSLELDLPEVQVVVDDAGRPVDARVRRRNRAHAWVEEAMLAANQAVARVLERAGRATLHRIHPPPLSTKLEALGELFERYGLDVPEDLGEPGALASALEGARGLPAEERLQVAALRSLAQARYAPASEGHFALRFEHYLHFTSPIRRYADLEVHRALRAWMRGAGARADATREGAELEGLATWLSGRERVAQAAERDAEALACCALLRGREGEVFEAKVSGASEFGLFVRCEAPAVSGLVPMRRLAGRWTFDEDEDALVEEGGQRRIATGETLRVRLEEVDPDRARLGFGLVGRDDVRGARREGRARDRETLRGAGPKRGARRGREASGQREGPGRRR